MWRQLIPMLIPDQYHTGVGRIQCTTRAFKQGLDDPFCIQAAQLTAEIKKKINFLKASSCLVQQRYILQDDRCLPSDLVIYLQIFIRKCWHWLRADSQHGGNSPLINSYGQTNQ